MPTTNARQPWLALTVCAIACSGMTRSTAVADAGKDVTRAEAADAPVPHVDADCTPDAGPEPPSCAAAGAGLTSCGVCHESCCASPLVSGGAYERSYGGDDAGEGGAESATVSDLRLDKYDVTVGRFRQFVNAWNGGYVPPAGSGKHSHLNGGQGLENSGSPGTYEPGWVPSDDSNLAPTDSSLASCVPAATWTSSPAAQENLPINCVNWWEAYAFCIWDGGFLPSEAEWEYVAAAGSENREYPWGSADPGTENEYAIFGRADGACYYPSSGPCTLGAGNIAPVGTATKGVGRWGQLDLGGEVQQWVLDVYATDYAEPCIDCAYLTPRSDRVTRGSEYQSRKEDMYPTVRSAGPPGSRTLAEGFRCARAP